MALGRIGSHADRCRHRSQPHSNRTRQSLRSNRRRQWRRCLRRRLDTRRLPHFPTHSSTRPLCRT
jgi:hypothetical protein